MQMVCNSLDLGFRNSVRNQMVWFPVWPNMAKTKPNQTSPTVVCACPTVPLWMAIVIVVCSVWGSSYMDQKPKIQPELD